MQILWFLEQKGNVKASYTHSVLDNTCWFNVQYITESYDR